MFSHFSYSNKGPIRKKNEDIVWSGVNDFGQGILIACDGVGGSHGGEIASANTLEGFSNSFLTTNFMNFSEANIRNWFEECLDEIRAKFIKEIKSNPILSDMSTTLTMSIILKHRVYTFNVGDTRCYFVKNGLVKQITKDHNVYNYLVDTNASQETWNKYRENLLSITSTVSAISDKKIKFDLFSNDLSEADMIVISTDGLYNFIDINDFLRLESSSLENSSKALINLAIKNGSNDNLSLSVINLA